MKDLWKKYRVICIITLVCSVIIIPAIINLLFKWHTNSAILWAEWDAGDVLTFYGEVLAAIATIVVVVLTINFTVNNQRIERKLSIKPHLESTTKSLAMDTETLQEVRPGNVSYISIGETISYHFEYQSIPGSEFHDNTAQLFTELNESRRMIVIGYELSNVGAGNALNINFTINGKSFMPKFAVTDKKTKRFILVFNSELITNHSSLVKLHFSYSDVASLGHYEQEESFELYRIENGEFLDLRKRTAQDFMSEPKEIKE
jgi:hypothetical protein